MLEIDLRSKHHHRAFRAKNAGSATHRRLKSASSHPMLTELVQTFKNSIKRQNDPWPNPTFFEGFWVSVFPYLLRTGNYIIMPWLSWFPNRFPGTQDSEQLDLLCMLLRTISRFEENNKISIIYIYIYLYQSLLCYSLSFLKLRNSEVSHPNFLWQLILNWFTSKTWFFGIYHIYTVGKSQKLFDPTYRFSLTHPICFSQKLPGTNERRWKSREP